jgi:hypothetical protein
MSVQGRQRTLHAIYGGIDVFIGDLGGLVTVWQSKYFFPEVSKVHRSQIRESFKSVTENAAKEGFKLTQWSSAFRRAWTHLPRSGGMAGSGNRNGLPGS